ncbi:MAG TPA: amino acid ABC transporter permease [Bradyrhizobium sp.]|uniref:amino acid ABC transporter permease n=1 Tax=Bradyrhizobium sp. TaxID=376 RepID=UPI002D7FC5F0|nr:amino acid ABC transporter permease [Bradyrhizobium sp.]HET7889562.1 amino acid ABC transporter permease [Bradyrhizobium sp.]
MHEYLAMLLALLRYNVTLTLLAVAIALPVSCACAFARLSRVGWVALSMRIYVNTLRSMPLVMVMFWIYMIVPMISGRALSAYLAALIALTCFEVAYFTEIVRAGVQSISSNQFAAAVATGLSRFQAARYVVIPQALRRMLPALLTQSLIAFQDSTISSIIGVPEMLQEATIINAREQSPVYYYALLALTFLVICYGTSIAVRRLETRLRVDAQRGKSWQT